MSENSLKKRGFLSYLFYTCAIIFVFILVVSYMSFREEQINVCLKEVYQDHIANWARYCKQNAKRERRQLKDCIEERKAIIRAVYSSSDDIEKQDKVALIQCRQMYGESDSSADCLLPKNLADSLNGDYEKSVEACKS